MTYRKTCFISTLIAASVPLIQGQLGQAVPVEPASYNDYVSGSLASSINQTQYYEVAACVEGLLGPSYVHLDIGYGDDGAWSVWTNMDSDQVSALGNESVMARVEPCFQPFGNYTLLEVEDVGAFPIVVGFDSDAEAEAFAAHFNRPEVLQLYYELDDPAAEGYEDESTDVDVAPVELSPVIKLKLWGI